MGIRQSDVPPDVWAKLLAAADQQRSAAPVAPDEPAEANEPPALVEPSFTPPACWVTLIVTASEANGRDWKARSNRTKAAQLAVSRAFGPHLEALAVFAQHYHSGGVLEVVFTRLGGRRLDASNLPMALKATEDAVALMLGADDGDPQCHPLFLQESGGAMGVRIKLRIRS